MFFRSAPVNQGAVDIRDERRSEGTERRIDAGHENGAENQPLETDGQNVSRKMRKDLFKLPGQGERGILTAGQIREELDGVNWIPFEVGLPNAVVYDLEIQRNTRKLVAGTHGRGAWEIALPPPASTGVSAAVEPAHPHLMLDPPFPNPVRDGTWLRWAARASGPVTVDVYDVRGRLVNRVAAEPRGDGVIRATRWLTDDVTSGVYFAVLTAGEDQIVRKVVVAR